MPNDLYHLIYTSKPAVRAGEKILLEILEESQNGNFKNRISGLLVFHRGRFIQLLEGRESDVKELFAIIQRDRRHTDIEIVCEGSSPTRAFPTWIMAFAGGNDVENMDPVDFYFSIGDIKDICRELNHPVGKIFLEFLDDSPSASD